MFDQKFQLHISRSFMCTECIISWKIENFVFYVLQLLLNCSKWEQCFRIVELLHFDTDTTIPGTGNYW